MQRRADRPAEPRAAARARRAGARPHAGHGHSASGCCSSTSTASSSSTTRSGTTPATSCSSPCADRLRRRAPAQRTVARFGGDEFAVLCERRREPARARRRSPQPLAARSPSRCASAGEEVFPWRAIGIALSPAATTRAERLLREADAAMYRAKAQRPRQRASTTTRLRAGAGRAADGARPLPRARARRARRPLPAAGPSRGGRALAGVEALVRWTHPERGLVGPDEFLGTAEDSGLIRRLGAWVLAEACRQLALWRAQGLGGGALTMAVNVSPRELADDGFVGPRRRGAGRARPAAPPRLCLEVPESVLRDGGDVPAGCGRSAPRRAHRRRRLRRRLVLALGPARRSPPTRSRSTAASWPGWPPTRRPATSSPPSSGSPARSACSRSPRAWRRRRSPARSPRSGWRSPRATPSRPRARRRPSRRCWPPTPAARRRRRGRSGSSCATTHPACAPCCARAWSSTATSEVVGEAGDGAGLLDAVRAVVRRRRAARPLHAERRRPRGAGRAARGRREHRRRRALGLRRAPDGGAGARPGADRYVEKTAAMQQIAADVREVAAARRGPRSLLEPIA